LAVPSFKRTSKNPAMMVLRNFSIKNLHIKKMTFICLLDLIAL
jgi:hypothetical protein